MQGKNEVFYKFFLVQLVEGARTRAVILELEIVWQIMTTVVAVAVLRICFIQLDEDALHAAPMRTMKLEPGSLSAACIGGRGEIGGT
jgi:hypothetical protein